MVVQSLYQGAVNMLLIAYFPPWLSGMWKLPIVWAENWVDLVCLYVALVYIEPSTFHYVLEGFMKIKLPPLDSLAKDELLSLLPYPVPTVLLPDLWTALLSREFEILFLQFWQSHEFLYMAKHFTKEEIEKKFKGSQLLYPFFETRRKDNLFEEAAKEMRNRFLHGFFSEQ